MLAGPPNNSRNTILKISWGLSMSLFRIAHNPESLSSGLAGGSRSNAQHASASIHELQDVSGTSRDYAGAPREMCCAGDSRHTFLQSPRNGYPRKVPDSVLGKYPSHFRTVKKTSESFKDRPKFRKISSRLARGGQRQSPRAPISCPGFPKKLQGFRRIPQGWPTHAQQECAGLPGKPRKF